MTIEEARALLDAGKTLFHTNIEKEEEDERDERTTDKVR